MTILMTWEDCIKNINLFEIEIDNDIKNGMFVVYNGNYDPIYFTWLCEGVEHREDGPAVIYQHRSTWYYQGERVWTKNQEGFRKWLDARLESDLNNWINKTINGTR